MNSSVIDVKYKNCRINKNRQDFLTRSPHYTSIFQWNTAVKLLHLPGSYLKSINNYYPVLSYQDAVRDTLYCWDQGFWYFAEKKAKFRGIFRGKFAEKWADFTGFSHQKSQNSRNSRPISGDLCGRKVKICRKIGPFRGILAEKSQISKDFQGQILRKIGRFHRKFLGETSPRNNQ